MLVGSMISGTIYNQKDYRKKDVEIKGIVIKESGSQCRVHVFEIDGKPADKIVLMHSAGFVVLSE
jgi:hypothetical protein